MTAPLQDRDLVSGCLQLHSDPNNTALPFRQLLIDDAPHLDVGTVGDMPVGLFHHTAAPPRHSAWGEGGTDSGDSLEKAGQLAEALEGAWPGGQALTCDYTSVSVCVHAQAARCRFFTLSVLGS